jgi:hypothetical protein
MRRHNTERKFWIGIPPWVILGAMLVLLPIFVFMTIENIHRQNANTTELLLEKGAALIRSFEAGARTGMMGMMGTRWGGNQIQRLLAETAQQPDIAYIMVTDVKGTILADSDPAMIGRTPIRSNGVRSPGRTHLIFSRSFASFLQPGGMARDSATARRQTIGASPFLTGTVSPAERARSSLWVWIWGRLKRRGRKICATRW